MFRFTITTLNDSGHGSVQRLSDFTLPLAGTVTGTVNTVIVAWPPCSPR